MQDFEAVTSNPESIARLHKDLMSKPDEWWIRLTGSVPRMKQEAVEAMLVSALGGQLFKNDTYQVRMQDAPCPSGQDSWPPMWHLSIKRLDKEPIRDWRVMQEIKNKLVGPENEGVEVYPAESRLVDGANQYHLWVFKDSECKFTNLFGFQTRVAGTFDIAGTKQRPRDNE